MYNPEVDKHTIPSSQVEFDCHKAYEEPIKHEAPSTNFAGGHTLRERLEQARVNVENEVIQGFENLLIKKGKEFPHLSIIELTYGEVIKSSPELPRSLIPSTVNNLLAHFKREGFELTQSGGTATFICRI